MDINSHLSDTVKKVSVTSMVIYLRKLSVKDLENVIHWAKVSKNPNANINTSTPNEWEQSLKGIFSKLTPKEQADVIAQGIKILEDKKNLNRK